MSLKPLLSAVSSKKPDFTYPGLILLLYFFLVLFALTTGFNGDKLWWTDWCNLILKNGMGKLYEGNIDYPPFYSLFLYLYVQIQGTSDEIVNNLHFLKAFTLIFDFAGAFLAISFVERSERKWLLPLFVLFNPAYLYNTHIWNQVDAILSALCLGAAVLALRQKIAWSMLIFLVALNTKLQSIIFLPPLLLLWLSVGYKDFSLKRLGLGFLLLLVAQYLIQGKIKSIPPDLVFLTMGMIALTFFFFLTEMHERYSHPALIMFYTYGFTKKRYLLIMLVSMAYFLNLEHVMQYLALKNYITLIFQPKLITGLFALAFVTGNIQLYITYFSK